MPYLSVSAYRHGVTDQYSQIVGHPSTHDEDIVTSYHCPGFLQFEYFDCDIPCCP